MSRNKKQQRFVRHLSLLDIHITYIIYLSGESGGLLGRAQQVCQPAGQPSLPGLVVTFWPFLISSIAMRALAARLNMAAAILAVISDNIPTVTGQKNVRNNSCTLRSIAGASSTAIINQDCDFCIQSAQCSWCADPNWSGPRCDQRAW